MQAWPQVLGHVAGSLSQGGSCEWEFYRDAHTKSDHSRKNELGHVRLG